VWFWLLFLASNFIALPQFRDFVQFELSCFQCAIAITIWFEKFVGLKQFEIPQQFMYSQSVWNLQICHFKSSILVTIVCEARTLSSGGVQVFNWVQQYLQGTQISLHLLWANLTLSIDWLFEYWALFEQFELHLNNFNVIWVSIY
jgi:hypothetical protein